MPFSTMKYSAKMGIMANKAVQVQSQVMVDSQCQSDPVVVLSPEEFQNLEKATQVLVMPAEVNSVPDKP